MPQNVMIIKKNTKMRVRYFPVYLFIYASLFSVYLEKLFSFFFLQAALKLS